MRLMRSPFPQNGGRAAKHIEVTRRTVKVESIEEKKPAYRGGVRIFLGERQDKTKHNETKFWLDLQREEALELADKLIARIRRELLEERKKRARRRDHKRMKAAEELLTEEYFRRTLKQILVRSGVPGHYDDEARKLVNLRTMAENAGWNVLDFYRLVDETIPKHWGTVNTADRYDTTSHKVLNRLLNLRWTTSAEQSRRHAARRRAVPPDLGENSGATDSESRRTTIAATASTNEFRAYSSCDAHSRTNSRQFPTARSRQPVQPGCVSCSYLSPGAERRVASAPSADQNGQQFRRPQFRCTKSQQSFARPVVYR